MEFDVGNNDRLNEILKKEYFGIDKLDSKPMKDKNFSIMGIWLRCNDKINRLKNLINRKGKNYVEGEGLVDSFIDISNYGIIAQLVLKNKWK